jgi:hypothetical protein
MDQLIYYNIVINFTLYTKMAPLVAFFLGILLVLVILIPFWYVATVNSKIGPVYKSIFCQNIDTNAVSNV